MVIYGLRRPLTLSPTNYGTRPIVDEQLNEIDNGCLERMSAEEIQQTYSEIREASKTSLHISAFPESAAGEEARQRIPSFLEKKRWLRTDKIMVMVSHEGLIRLLTCHILGLPMYPAETFMSIFAQLWKGRTSQDINPGN